MKKKYNRDDNTIDDCGNVFRSEIRGYILLHDRHKGPPPPPPPRGEKTEYTIYIYRYRGIKNWIYG